MKCIPEMVGVSLWLTYFLVVHSWSCWVRVFMTSFIPVIRKSSETCWLHAQVRQQLAKAEIPSALRVLCFRQAIKSFKSTMAKVLGDFFMFYNSCSDMMKGLIGPENTKICSKSKDWTGLKTLWSITLKKIPICSVRIQVTRTVLWWDCFCSCVV